MKQRPRNTGSVQAASRWPALLAFFAMGALFFALPTKLTFGPDWLVFLLIAVLTTAASIAHRQGRSYLNFKLGLIESGVVTVALAWSLVMLIIRLPGHGESAKQLARGAIALWLSNILIFASWYWRLDAGGPNLRDRRDEHVEGDFLFPQMTLPPAQAQLGRGWRPGFVDYLFLAFNASTAFSPSDTPVLSRWAKVLMMIQSLISLGIIGILAARVISIL